MFRQHCQQHTMSPCHCPEIMWALRRRNTRISSDFVMRFLPPSVKRPQTEQMHSTKACDAGALIRSCAKGASRGYTGIRCSCSWKAFHQCGDVQGDQGWAKHGIRSKHRLSLLSTISSNKLQLKLLSWKRLKLGPKTLRMQAKTIWTFHNFSSWYNFRSTSIVRKQLI